MLITDPWRDEDYYPPCALDGCADGRSEQYEQARAASQAQLAPFHSPAKED